MTVTIDSREPTRLKKKLSRKGVDTKGEYLEIGDYLLPGNVIIERKTGKDFVASIMGKRIWTQAKNMSQYDHPIIAVITNNKWKDFYFRKGKYAHKSWAGALATLSSKYNISVLRFDDENEYLNYLKALDKKLTGESKSARPSPIARKATSLEDRKENALCAAEGVSIKTAKDILEYYTSVKKVANESEKDLQKVDGVGPKTAKNIYKAFH